MVLMFDTHSFLVADVMRRPALGIAKQPRRRVSHYRRGALLCTNACISIVSKAELVRVTDRTLRGTYYLSDRVGHTSFDKR